ncbi:hypothetical protein Moror_17501 [Moniliophthora roreri MCA 2997]|uniref:Uncharacterized protein n=1 Tax=Moniliophthora roreri (strain MCA 2997) TaxID=1381753 RepID=V2Z123_MONRO|nr:hypothetical protein Moror_17501 [Moniliophthora roreri MCA 2997]
MPSYYPTQGTHYSHRSRRSHHSTPVVYASTHPSHHGVPAVAASQAYYPQTTHGGGNNVVYVPTHSSSSRHGHHTVVPSYVVSSGSRHHGSHHHESSHHHHHHHRRPTLGERIRNFFSFGRRRHQPRYKVKSANSSWGFLGRSRRRRYVDMRTGEEVDRRGRRVYNV